MLVQPAEELHGGLNAVSGALARGLGVGGTPVRGAAGAAQHEPVGERPDQPGVVAGQADQELLQPGRDALQILHPLRQDAGVDQDLPEVMQAVGLGQLVEQVVADRLVLGSQAGKQPS